MTDIKQKALAHMESFGLLDDSAAKDILVAAFMAGYNSGACDAFLHENKRQIERIESVLKKNSPVESVA